MEVLFHSHANKTHCHKKGCALGLILKVKVFKSVLADSLPPLQNKQPVNQTKKQIKTKNKQTIFRHLKTILDLKCHTLVGGK